MPGDSTLVLGDFDLPDVTWFFNEDLRHFITLSVPVAYIDFVDRIHAVYLMQCSHIYNVKLRLHDSTILNDTKSYISQENPFDLSEDVYHPTLLIRLTKKLPSAVRKNSLMLIKQSQFW